MKRILLTLSGIFIALQAIEAQEVMRLSMKECMDYALKHNYSIKNAQIDVLIQEAQNKQTLSASYPHVNGKLDLTNFDVPQRQFIDASTFPSSGTPVPKGTIVPISFTIPYTASGTITTSQLLFDGAVFVAWRARNTVMELARRNEAVTEESVRYNVHKAYNSLVIAYRQFDIIKRSLGYARSLEHDLEVTRQNGFAEKIDVDRTTVQVNNLAADSIRVANMLGISEDLLKLYIGMGMDSRIVLTDTNVEENWQAVVAMIAEEKNYDRVPEYNLLNTSLKLNEYNLRRYRLVALPTLNAFWAYGYNYGSDKFNKVFRMNEYLPSSTIGLSLNMPIYNGSLRMQQVREAKLNIEKSKNSIENLKLSLDFQVTTSRTSLKNAVIQVQSQRRNMQLADDILTLAQKKYKAGVGSNLEVTQAQTDLLRAQNNYFAALLDAINAEADLKKALGLLK